MHLLQKNGKKSSLFNRVKISLFETQSPYFKTQISLFGPKKISHVCIIEPIFRIFVALLTIFGLQKDDMVIFFLWCFRKVRF